MSTVLDLISAAARKLGVQSASETLSSSDQTVLLFALNALIDSWGAQGFTVYSGTRQVFPLTSSQQVYTMGPGGGFNSVRPISIENCGLILTSSGGPIELPIRVLDTEEWSREQLKTLVSNSTFPVEVWADFNYPLCNLTFWPIPSVSCSVAIYATLPVSQFVAVTDTLSLAPGYLEAMIYNLAVRAAAEFGRPVPPEVGAIANDGMRFMKSNNASGVHLRNDSALRTNSGGYNVYSDDN